MNIKGDFTGDFRHKTKKKKMTKNFFLIELFKSFSMLTASFTTLFFTGPNHKLFHYYQ